MIDLAALQRVLDAPPAHPEIMGDAVAVSRDWLRAVKRELTEKRKAGAR